MEPQVLFRPQSVQNSEFDYASARLRISSASRWVAIFALLIFALLVSVAVFAQYKPSDVAKGTVTTLDVSVPIDLPQGAYLTSYLVAHGDLVKAGDPVAEIAWRLEFDQSAIQAKQLELYDKQHDLKYAKYQLQLQQVEREQAAVSNQLAVHQQALARRTSLAGEYQQYHKQLQNRVQRISELPSSAVLAPADIEQLNLQVVEAKRRYQLEIDTLNTTKEAIQRANDKLRELDKLHEIHHEQYLIDMQQTDIEQEGVHLKTNQPLRAPLDGRVLITDTDSKVRSHSSESLMMIADPDMKIGIEVWLDSSYKVEQADKQVAARFGHLPWATHGEFALTLYKIDNIPSTSPWGGSGYRAVFEITDPPSTLAIGDDAEVAFYKVPRSLLAHLVLPSAVWGD